MKINNEQVKRLGIYFFYEKEGIVDSYVKYFFLQYISTSLPGEVLHRLVLRCC